MDSPWPRILFEEAAGVFPVESVLFTIEVKSTLTMDELRKAHESAAELSGFDNISGEHDEDDRPISHRIKKVMSTILAFDTDLSRDGKNEAERYKGMTGPGTPPIQMICVVDRGY